ncbi:MAG TPA: AMP-binding protein [Candidatus Saccharimonadaceae bacterium]|jgi:phenylacetate-CoA ligase|nr:AMP-binding protein [Candidatus Saccharimonadaceae bacterium]
MTMRASLRRLTAPVKRLRVGEAWVRRNPLYFPQALRRFAELSAARLDERRVWTEQRLARVLGVAARTAYGRAAGGARLADWPLLEPATVRERPLDFVRPGVWSIPSSTGGTTGIPLPLARSPRSVAVEQAALDHVLATEGVDSRRARVAVLRGDDVKPLDDTAPPYWVDTLGGRRRVFSSNHLTRATRDTFLAGLAEFAADVWWVYPTALESLVRLCDDGTKVPRVRTVMSSSEVLGPWTRDAARRRFGARVVDYYGQAERVAFAWCVDEGGWRFLPGYAHVEWLPRPDAGDTVFEIVGTGLWNEAMPLVRYRTGDLVRFDARPSVEQLEAIALGVGTFPGVIGRDGDILVAPDGARLTGIDHFHRGVENLVRVQVVHAAPDLVEIHVLPAPGFGEADRAQLIANARRKVPGSMRVEVRVVEALERTALGKTPFVLRRPGVPGDRA